MAKWNKLLSMEGMKELIPTENPVILDAMVKTQGHIYNQARNYGKIVVSISGGSDSDIMLDMFERIGYPEGLVEYVWFDTGLELDATKRHLKELEKKYGIVVRRCRPKLTVAQATKRYGLPFISKLASTYIKDLQRVDFQFMEDGGGTSEDFYNLRKKYKKITGIKWWLGLYDKPGYGQKGALSVEKNYGLKEFMTQYPPDFAISNKCCEYAKKEPSHRINMELGATLNVVGLRQAEGGMRSIAIHSCFSEATETRIAQFRPIFWFADMDKVEYKRAAGIRYSDCYEVWGFKRTGCVGCPFNSKFEEDMKVVEQYEPKLYKAACKIFGPSYEYTRKYRAFKEDLKRKRREERKRQGQFSLFDAPETIENCTKKP